MKGALQIKFITIVKGYFYMFALQLLQLLKSEDLLLFSVVSGYKIYIIYRYI